MQDFKKTVKQVEAIDVLRTTKHTALYGGSRSGKTFIIIYALIIRASKVKSRHLTMRRTFASVKRAIFLDTFPKVMRICFPHLKVKYNKTDYYVTFPNGSEIWFSGMDNGDRVEKILGMEFSTIYFNEASELDYAPIQTVISRLAEKNSLVNKTFYDFNPPSRSHFSYALFIQKLNPIDDEPLENPEDYNHLLMNPQDNIENIDEEYIKLLERMPKADRERFLKGLFGDDAAGATYYAFDRDRHVKENVKPLMGTVFVGMDFNVNPFCAILFSYNGKFHVFDEVYLENSDTFKMCDELIRRGYRGATVIPDSTGKNRKTSGKSDHAILREYGFTIPSVRNPFVKDRVNNVNRLLTADNIIIDKKCKKLINDLVKVVWDKNGKLDQKTNTMLTHVSDCLGYGAWHLDKITHYGKKKVSTEWI